MLDFSLEKLDFSFYRLVVYLLVEAGDAVRGKKLEMVSRYIKESAEVFRKIGKDHQDIDICFRVMRYSTGAAWHSEMVDIEEMKWKDIQPGGDADLGAAFKLLKKELDETNEVGYIIPPVIVLFSASAPTDSVTYALRKLKTNMIFRQAAKVAYILDYDHVDLPLLRRFTGSEDGILSGRIPMGTVLSGFVDWNSKKQLLVSDLQLPHEIACAIKKAGINLVDDLTMKTRGELQDICNMDNIALDLVEEKLSNIGMRLTMYCSMGCITIREEKEDKPVNLLNVEELELSVRSFNLLKRAGVNTVEELCNKTLEEVMRICKYAEKSVEEIIERIAELGLHLRDDEDKEYTEYDHPGRDKCNQLRALRKKIAKANDIPFETKECHHKGPCSGTCVVCDAEIQYLDKKLQEKKAAGDTIELAGIAEVEFEKAVETADTKYELGGSFF